MQPLVVVPHHVGIGETSLDGKKLGVLCIKGADITGRISIDVVLDMPTLGQVVAALDELRMSMIE